jgi:SAM-dependent methyltransferase
LTPEQVTVELIWLQGVHKRRAYEQLFRALEDSRRPVSSILDIGCGTGGFLSFAKSQGVTELYGFDASKAQVAHARQTVETVRGCTSLQAYIRALGRIPHWDLITLWDVLEHLRQPRELLREIRAFCAPGCAVFVSTPNATGEFVKYGGRRAFFRGHSFVPWEHVMYCSRAGLHRLLRQCGFEPVYSSGTICYERRLDAFEALRRAGFALSRRTALAPQLFVISRPGSQARACAT